MQTTISDPPAPPAAPHKARGSSTPSLVPSSSEEELQQQGGDEVAGDGGRGADAASSPFIDQDHPITPYEAAKMVVMLPVVVAKLAYLALALVYAWALMRVLLVGHTPGTPMGRWRRAAVREWVRVWARFVLFVSGYVYVPVTGWSHVAEAERARAVLVFNHVTYCDAALMAYLFTGSGVAKAGVGTMPVIGTFARALQIFFVARRGSADRTNRYILQADPIQAIAQRAADMRFPLVMIAPEATTKPKRCLLKFRRGAFATGRPVCPVLIKYRYRHFNPGWGIVYTPLHCYRLLAQFVNHVEVEVLPVYHPSAEENANPALLAQNVRVLMAERLGVPLVEQGVHEEHALLQSGVRPNLLGTSLVHPDKRKLE